MLFVILLTVQIIIGIALVGLILVQRSEGGALGMGGSPSGFMSARGAGNFLTRTTSILAVLFFANCIGLTIISNLDRRGTSVVDQVGAENVLLNEADASAAAAAQATGETAGAQASSPSGPSLTDLPAPTTAAPTATPSLSTLGSASASSSSRSAASPAPRPAAPAPASRSATAPAASSPASASAAATSSAAASQ